MNVKLAVYIVTTGL